VPAARTRARASQPAPAKGREEKARRNADGRPRGNTVIALHIIGKGIHPFGKNGCGGNGNFIAHIRVRYSDERRDEGGQERTQHPPASIVVVAHTSAASERLWQANEAAAGEGGRRATVAPLVCKNVKYREGREREDLHFQAAAPQQLADVLAPRRLACLLSLLACPRRPESQSVAKSKNRRTCSRSAARSCMRDNAREGERGHYVVLTSSECLRSGRICAEMRSEMNCTICDELRANLLGGRE